MHACMHTYIHTYIDTHMHTYIHTYKYYHYAFLHFAKHWYPNLHHNRLQAFKAVASSYKIQSLSQTFANITQVNIFLSVENVNSMLEKADLNLSVRNHHPCIMLLARSPGRLMVLLRVCDLGRRAGRRLYSAVGYWEYTAAWSGDSEKIMGCWGGLTRTRVNMKQRKLLP